MATGLDGFGPAGEFTVEDFERMPDDGRRLVARRADLLTVEGGKFLAEPPVLAVEVLSPSSRRIDRLSKLSAYEEAGVASYWLVDPDPQAPSLQALWRASQIPDAGPNKVWTGTKGVKCQNGAGSTHLSLRTKQRGW